MKILPLAKIAAAKKRLIEQTKEPSMKLRNAHWEQLRLYAAHCKDDGWYYGNKAQFQKRHDEIMRFLDKQCADSMSRPEKP